MKTALLGLLALVGAVFLFAWVRDLAARRAAGERLVPRWLEAMIGFVTNFFDTLGIGSFAPTTFIYKLKRMVPDEQLPGTLNVGHGPPVILQAFIFVTAVAVEPRTLVVLMGGAVLGGWLGAGVVSRWPRRNIQVGMGLGLLFFGMVLILRNLDGLRATPLFPGGEAIGLSLPLLVVAAVVVFMLGALLTLGIGFYAPCLILISLLGMNPRAAFPIMMGACAFLMPIASLRFIRAARYAPGPALGLAVGGLPAVAIAGIIVKELPLDVVRWLVVVVVIYTAVMMLRSATGAALQDRKIP